MKTPPPTSSQNDFQDSDLLREQTASLRLLVREAAARLKRARVDREITRLVQGFGKGNGERFQSSRY